MLHQRHEQLRRPSKERCPELVDACQELTGVEARIYNHGGSVVNHEVEVTDDAHGVKPRHYNKPGFDPPGDDVVLFTVTLHEPHAQYAVFIGYIPTCQPMGELAAVHKRIKVGKDDTLWCAGGATCIGDVDDVHLGVDLDLWGRRLVTGDELAEVSCTFRDRSFTQHLHGSRYGRVVVGQAHYYG